MCRSADVKQAVLAHNDDLARALRAELDGRGVAVVNLLSSPGSGKTELLGRVLAHAVRRGVPVAALTAEGESRVSGVGILSRGYEKFLTKLDAVGADFDVIR